MKLDKKFYISDGALRKAKTNEVVPEDEYVVFLAKDTAFVSALLAYRTACQQLGADATQQRMVDELIDRVNAWRLAHPDRCKVPDAAGERVLA